jgi:hypothetical protein
VEVVSKVVLGKGTAEPVPSEAEGAVPPSPQEYWALAPDGFTSDALTEIDRFFKKTGNIIIALTVQEILDEQIAKKLA